MQFNAIQNILIEMFNVICLLLCILSFNFGLSMVSGEFLEISTDILNKKCNGFFWNSCAILLDFKSRFIFNFQEVLIEFKLLLRKRKEERDFFIKGELNVNLQ